MSRSQISIEFLFASGIILLLFIILFAFITDRNKDISSSAKEISQKDNCILMSSLAASAFISGSGTIITAQLDHDANITSLGSASNTIHIGNADCFLAVHTLPMASLNKGTILFQNTNSYIDIKNV